MMKILKKVLVTIITIFLILMLAFNLYNFISIKILKKDLATINGYGILEVVSGSMEPTINVGDIIIINTKEKNLKKDDIVTFYDEERSLVTHRLVSINKDYIVTKGDNNKGTLDDPIPVKDIVGKYEFKINGLGNFIKAFKNPFISIMILIVGTLICILISKNDLDQEILKQDNLYQEFLEYNKEDREENKIIIFWQKLKAKRKMLKREKELAKKLKKEKKRKRIKKKKKDRKRKKKNSKKRK